MIRIRRPAKPPATLRNRGQQEKEILCDQYDANPAGYDAGRMKFPTAKKLIYGSSAVRNVLIKCQHNKCCYSEAKFVRDYVPVEHFRPKGAIGQQGSSEKQYPGYYWLAYEWSNLLLCKPGVNSNKKDYFPLSDEATRANNHHGDLGMESPMLIDPASEDPREHIRFHDEEPYGITDRGRYTVDLLLRHPDLDEDRRTRFNHLDKLKLAIKALNKAFDDTGNEEMRDTANLIKAQLDAAIEPHAEYSSMAIDLLSR